MSVEPVKRPPAAPHTHPVTRAADATSGKTALPKPRVSSGVSDLDKKIISDNDVYETIVDGLGPGEEKDRKGILTDVIEIKSYRTGHLNATRAHIQLFIDVKADIAARAVAGKSLKDAGQELLRDITKEQKHLINDKDNHRIYDQPHRAGVVDLQHLEKLISWAVNDLTDEETTLRGKTSAEQNIAHAKKDFVEEHITDPISQLFNFYLSYPLNDAVMQQPEYRQFVNNAVQSCFVDEHGKPRKDNEVRARLHRLADDVLEPRAQDEVGRALLEFLAQHPKSSLYAHLHRLADNVRGQDNAGRALLEFLALHPKFSP